MKQSVITELTTAEIQDKIVDEKANLLKLRLNHAVAPLENPMKISQSRKIIARLYTEIRKRELAQ
jgi:large subunit ribosomal protein L29